MSKVIFLSKGHVGTIILNNPKKLNALEFEMIKDLDKILDRAKNSKLKAITIKGSGNSFCSGGDISWEKQLGVVSAAEAKKQITSVQKVFSKIEKIPQVVIAVIDGFAVGGGNELAMACDIRIALPAAKFRHPEVSIGTIAPLGATKRLPRLVGLGKAKYLLFTGSTIDSKTAFEWGLVDFVVPQKKLSSFLNSILEKIAASSNQAIKLTKESVNKNYLQDLNDKFEADSYIKCSRTEENKKSLDVFLKSKN